MKSWPFVTASVLGGAAGTALAITLILTWDHSAGEDPRVASWGLWIAVIAFGATFAARRTELWAVDLISHFVGGFGVALALMAIGDREGPVWASALALGLVISLAVIYATTREDEPAPPMPVQEAPQTIIGLTLGLVLLATLFRRDKG